MLTGAAHDPQLAEAYRLLISKVGAVRNLAYIYDDPLPL